MAHLHIKPIRRDKKYPVTFIFLNGVRSRKLLTIDSLRKQLAKGNHTIALGSMPIANAILKS